MPAEPDRLLVQTRHLLGRRVKGPHGDHVGHVVDLRAVQDGPIRDGTTATLRIDGLVVGHHGLGERLGFSRHAIKGPWLLKRLAALGKPCQYLPWDQLEDPLQLDHTDGPLRYRGHLQVLDI